jgi:hypothetical protein
MLRAYPRAAFTAPVEGWYADFRFARYRGAEARRDGTRMTFMEQSVYLDGADYPAQRVQGAGAMLDSLEAELRREPANA